MTRIGWLTFHPVLFTQQQTVHFTWRRHFETQRLINPLRKNELQYVFRDFWTFILILTCDIGRELQLISSYRNGLVTPTSITFFYLYLIFFSLTIRACFVINITGAFVLPSLLLTHTNVLRSKTLFAKCHWSPHRLSAGYNQLWASERAGMVTLWVAFIHLWAFLLARFQQILLLFCCFFRRQLYNITNAPHSMSSS